MRGGGARPGEGDDARDGLHYEVAQPAAAAERGDDGRALPLEDVEDLRLRHPQLVGALVRVGVMVSVRGRVRVRVRARVRARGRVRVGVRGRVHLGLRPREVVREEEVRRDDDRRVRLQPLAWLGLGLGFGLGLGLG